MTVLGAAPGFPARPARERYGLPVVPAVAAALVPSAAWAHGAVQGVGAFYGGLLHPWITPTQAIALALLGLLFGQRGLPRSVSSLGSLVIALAVGLLLSHRGDEATTQMPLLLLAVAAGLAVVAARTLPDAGAMALAGAIGLAVGLGSDPDGANGATRWAALGGTALGVPLAVACVAGLVDRARAAWLRIGVRVAGSWLTASALLVLALSLARR